MKEQNASLQHACQEGDVKALQAYLDQPDADLACALRSVFASREFKKGQLEIVKRVALDRTTELCLSLPNFIHAHHQAYTASTSTPLDPVWVNVLLDHLHHQPTHKVNATLTVFFMISGEMFIPLLNQMLDHPLFATHYERFDLTSFNNIFEAVHLNPSTDHVFNPVWEKIKPTLSPKDVFKIINRLNEWGIALEGEEACLWEGLCDIVDERDGVWKKELSALLDPRQDLLLPLRVKSSLDRVWIEENITPSTLSSWGRKI